MDIATQIRTKRESAERARRLSLLMSNEEDRKRAVAFAGELDAEADELERGLKSAPPPQTVTQFQMQVQGQQATKANDDDAEQ